MKKPGTSRLGANKARRNQIGYITHSVFQGSEESRRPPPFRLGLPGKTLNKNESSITKCSLVVT